MEFDAFLSHSSEDKSAVQQIAEALQAREINVWFDVWELQPGVPWMDGLEKGLRASRATVVFIGRKGLGKWERPEMQVALNLQVKDQRPVIPVLLPGTPPEVKETLPEFLRLNTWVEFKNGLHDPDEMNRLIHGITGINPRLAHRTAPLTPVSAGPPQIVEQAVAALAAHLLDNGTATFFLGWGVADENQARQRRADELARALLEKLALIEQDSQQLLPPLDLAGFYYAIGNSNDTVDRAGDGALQREVVQLLRKRSALAKPPLHDHLAQLIKLLAQRPVGRRRHRWQQLLVTTNLDLLLERALLRAGLSFTRIVQHRSARRLTINEFRDVQLVSGGREVSVTISGQTEVARLNENNDLDELIESDEGRRVEQSPNVYGGDSQNPLETLSLKNLPEPILYKFLGSQDVKNSCVISASQYIEFAQLALQHNCIPTSIREIIANSAAIFFGMNYLDADFRLLCQLLIREQLKRITEDDIRLALHPNPQTALAGPDRLQTHLWERLKAAQVAKLGIQTLEAHGEDFLRRLNAQVEVGL